MNINYDIPVPNIFDAIRCGIKIEMYQFAQMLFDSKSYDIYRDYYPCLTSTNELSQIMQTKRYIKPGASVLTVSGSGEQLFFFKLYGAEHVLTFDISYNSYLMTQLKIAALKTYDNATDYRKFLFDLYGIDNESLLETESVFRAIQNLNKTEQDYRTGLEIFYTNKHCDLYDFSKQDYATLREKVKDPIPFVWTDIMDLDDKLDKDQKFDVIYYSNILQFLHKPDIEYVLENTKNHLKPKGKLFLVTNNRRDKDLRESIDNTFGLSSLKVFRGKRGFYLLMLKTR